MSSNATEYVIEKSKLHIINEVKKYAKQKRILAKLSNAYIEIEDEITLQNKSIRELYVIYNTVRDDLHIYIEQMENIRNYMYLVTNIITPFYISNADFNIKIILYNILK